MRAAAAYLGCASGIKKGPRRPLFAHRHVRGRLPAPGDAPPKYDNKIAHRCRRSAECCVQHLNRTKRGGGQVSKKGALWDGCCTERIRNDTSTTCTRQKFRNLGFTACDRTQMASTHGTRAYDPH